MLDFLVDLGPTAPWWKNYFLSMNRHITLSRSVSVSSLILFLFLNRFNCSETKDDSPSSTTPDPNDSMLFPSIPVVAYDMEQYYNHIIEDKCGTIIITNIAALSESRFTSAIDKTGLDRTPLQVAVDHQSLNCVRYILRKATFDLNYEGRKRKEQELVEARDKRGWRAVEHALRYFPYVASMLVPYEDLNVTGCFDHFISFAMLFGPLHAHYFLLNLTTRRDIIILSSVQRFLMILRELMKVAEPNSKSSELFLEKYLKDMKYEQWFRREMKQPDALEELKNVFIESLRLNCFTLYVNKILMATLEEVQIVALIDEAIALENSMATKDILETWCDGNADKRNTVLGILENRLMVELEGDSESKLMVAKPDLNAYQKLAVAFHPEFLTRTYSKVNLMIDSGAFEALGEKERAEFLASIPSVVYGGIPTVLVLAFNNSDNIKLIWYLYKNKKELFTANFEGVLAMDLIACYTPEIYFSKSRAPSSLKFVLSDKCKSHPTTKTQAIKPLLDQNPIINFVKENVELKWEVLHELLYEANSEELLEIIQKGIERRNFELVLGAAELRDEPFPFTTFVSVLKCQEVNPVNLLNFTLELMNYGLKEETVPVEHKESVKQALDSLVNPDQNLLNHVASKFNLE